MSREPAAVDTDPRAMLDLDLETVEPRLVDDDGRIVVALQDADGVAYLSVRRNPDAVRSLRRLRVKLERLEAEVQRRTVGYQPSVSTPVPSSTPVGGPWWMSEHGPLTGPGAFPKGDPA